MSYEELYYLEVLQDHDKLVREIDVIINGDRAARQASLCDLVGQIEELVGYREKYNNLVASLGVLV